MRESRTMACNRVSYSLRCALIVAVFALAEVGCKLLSNRYPIWPYALATKARLAASFERFLDDFCVRL